MTDKPQTTKFAIKGFVFKKDTIAPAFGFFPTRRAAGDLQRTTLVLQRGYKIVPAYISEEKP